MFGLKLVKIMLRKPILNLDFVGICDCALPLNTEVEKVSIKALGS